MKPYYTTLFHSFIIFYLFSTFTISANNLEWEIYKNRFLMPDGRIIDTTNKNISHSEGQGVSMLLAVFNNDRSTLEKTWKWANKMLYQKDTGLYAWRYNPNSHVHVVDKNNASDGDILIAWALLLAGEKWNDRRYTTASEKLQKSLINNTVIDYLNYKIMLPGVKGFNHISYIIINPSYFIFPAWKDFYKHSHLEIWKDLDESAIRMLSNMTFGELHLPTDWVEMKADGTMRPAKDWPPLFGYDAIRIPQYLRWAYPDSLLLKSYILWWKIFPRDATPAWVNVITGITADNKMSSGLLSIRDLVINDTVVDSINLDSVQKNDYYSSSLQLLSFYIGIPRTFPPKVPLSGVLHPIHRKVP